MSRGTAAPDSRYVVPCRGYCSARARLAWVTPVGPIGSSGYAPQYQGERKSLIPLSIELRITHSVLSRPTPVRARAGFETRSRCCAAPSLVSCRSASNVRAIERAEPTAEASHSDRVVPHPVENAANAIGLGSEEQAAAFAEASEAMTLPPTGVSQRLCYGSLEAVRRTCVQPSNARSEFASLLRR
jgi:hypothetical protein